VLNDQPLNDRARLSVTAASLAGDMPQRFAVPARALVNIMKERSLDGITLLKIDAEGHELEIVKGIGERLRSVQNMIVEVHDASLPKCNEMLRLLAAAEFEFFTVHGKRWLGPQDEIPEINLWVRSRCAMTPVQG
jgi:Methyltransferase FkbM domain